MQPGRNLGCGQQIIVRIEYQRRAVGQARTDFHLCFQYILAGAQIFQVRDADHGNDSRGRPHTAGQPLNFAGVVHPHLHHGILGGVLQAEEGVGYADVVVLVALGLEGIAKRRQHRIAEFLGGGLAHTARHSDDPWGEQHAVVGGHTHHGQGTVRYHHGAFCRNALHRMVGNDIGGTVR